MSYRQKILALEEPLPAPNAPFRKSVGPKFPPKTPGPKVPRRSSLRAIAHLNNQNKYTSIKSKLSKVTKASKSLEELGLEAVSIPLPDSPPLELDVFTEYPRTSADPSQQVDVPVFMAQSSGRLPLRQFSTSPLRQEIEVFPSPDSARDSALGISPMTQKAPQLSLLDLALKSPRVPPKKRPAPLAPIAQPTTKVASKSPPRKFSDVLSESSWPLPAVTSKDNSRSASFSSVQRKTELSSPHEIARASSFSSTQRRTELIVPLENPRTAPLSPAQQKQEIVRQKSVIQAALDQEKEELAKRRSEKKEILNQEKKEVAKQKSLKRETLDQEKKTEIVRLKSLRRGSSADLVRLKSLSLKRESSRSPGSASFADNAKRFSTLAPSFRIGKTKPRPNLSLKGSTLAPSSTDYAITTRKSWVFGRPGAEALDSPPLTSLTFSNWGESNESKYDIAAPPPSPATLAASIKTNKKRISFQKQQKKAAKAKAKAVVAAKKAKAMKKAKATEEEKSRKRNLSPEAERYYTRSPYDFSSSSSSETSGFSDNDDDDEENGEKEEGKEEEEDRDEDEDEEFPLDTNCVPGSAQQNPLSALSFHPYDGYRNWSTTNHFGDGKDSRRSMSIYSHQGSQSVYSVDTQGFPPHLNLNLNQNDLLPNTYTDTSSGYLAQGQGQGHRRPMSSLNSPTSTTGTMTTSTSTILSPGLSSPGATSMAVPPLFHRVSLNQFSASPFLNRGLASPVDFVVGEYEEEIEELARGFLEEEGGDGDV